MKSNKFAALLLITLSACTVKVENTFDTDVPVKVDVPPGAVVVYSETTVQAGTNLSVPPAPPPVIVAEGNAPVPPPVDTMTSASVPVQPTTPVTETEPEAVQPSPITLVVSRTDAFHAATDVVVAPGAKNVNLRTFMLKTFGGYALLTRFSVATYADSDAPKLGECRLHAWPETDRCESSAMADGNVVTFDLANDDCVVGPMAEGAAVAVDVDCDILDTAPSGTILDFHGWAMSGVNADEAVALGSSATVTFGYDERDVVHQTIIQRQLTGRAFVTQVAVPTSVLTSGEMVVARFTVTALDGDIEFQGYAWGYGVELPLGASFTTGTSNQQLRVVGSSDVLYTTVVEGRPTGLPFAAAFQQALFIPKDHYQTFELVIPVGGDILSGTTLHVQAPDVKVNGEWLATATDHVFTK